MASASSDMRPLSFVEPGADRRAPSPYSTSFPGILGTVMSQIKDPRDFRSRGSMFARVCAGDLVFGLILAGALLERGAQDVAERRTRVGRAVLRQSFLLLGDFERLDGDAELVRLAVELGDAGVHLLANREALGAL